MSAKPDASDLVSAAPLSLAYARLLYAGGVRYRSRLGAAFLTIAVAATAGCAAVVADRHADLAMGGRMAFATGGLVALTAAAHLAAGMVVDRREGFEITTAGIRTGAGLTPWPLVTRVVAGGSAAGPGVRLFFARRRATARDAAVATVQLSTTRRITPAEYESLLELLRREVLPTYPHLDLGGYESPRVIARQSAAKG